MGGKKPPSKAAKLIALAILLLGLGIICCLAYLLLPQHFFDSVVGFFQSGGGAKGAIFPVEAPFLILFLILAAYGSKRIYQAHEKAWFSNVFNRLSGYVQENISDPEPPIYCEDIRNLKDKLFPEVDLHGVPLELYGRDAEIEWLKNQVSILLSGGTRAARAVLLWGEQGIGKTQLAYCFADDLAKKSSIFRKWNVWYLEGVFDAASLLEALPNTPVLLVWDDVSLSEPGNAKSLKTLLSNRGRKNPIFIIVTGWEGQSDDLFVASDRAVNDELQVRAINDDAAVKIYPNARLIPVEQRGHPLLLRLLADQDSHKKGHSASYDKDFSKDPLWTVCRKWAKSFRKRLDQNYGLSSQAMQALAVVSCSGRCSWRMAIDHFSLKDSDQAALIKTGRLRDRSGELWLEPLRPDLLGWAFCLEILYSAPTHSLKKWSYIAPDLGPLVLPRFVAFSFQKKQNKNPWVKMLRYLISDSEVNLFLNVVDSLEKIEEFSRNKKFEKMELELLSIYESAAICKSLPDAKILAADAAASAVEAYFSCGNDVLAKPHLDFIANLAASPQVGVDFARVVTRIQLVSIKKAVVSGSSYGNEKSYNLIPDNIKKIEIEKKFIPAAWQKFLFFTKEFKNKLTVFVRVSFKISAVKFFTKVNYKKDSKSYFSQLFLALDKMGFLQFYVKFKRIILIQYVLIFSFFLVSLFHVYAAEEFKSQLLYFFLCLASLALMLISKNNALNFIDLVRSVGDRISAQSVKLEESEIKIQTLDQQRMQAYRDAESAVLAKGEFLATMSHEIRAPLNGIVPMLDLLMHNRLPPDQAELVHTAFLSSQQMLRIVDDILDYSKLEASKLQLETTTFNLRETLETLIQLMDRPAQSKGLRLSLHIDPTVRLPVRGDPVRLRQVISNLLSNAVKFTERGSVSLSVRRLGETSSQYQLRFEVRDTGIGISQAAQARLFQAFSQADASTTRLYGGTGLGLAISKRIIDLMGGKIGVESTSGQGANFWFEIPLLKVQGAPTLESYQGRSDISAQPKQQNSSPQEASDESLIKAEVHTATAIPISDHRMRVLLVEDNPVNLMVGQRLLSVLGTHCDTATNGEAALLRMQASRYDLVLMDCQMPVMDGYTASRRWREYEAMTGAGKRRLPIVAMTANAMAGDRQKCLDSGMDDYFAKPITRGELERCLSHWQHVSTDAKKLEPEVNLILPPPPPMPPPIEPAAPVVDLGVLDELRSMLGNEVDRLIEVFLDDSPRLMAALEMAAAAPDYEMLRNAAHTLRASSMNLGAVSLSVAAKKVETGARNKSLEHPAVAVALISHEFDRTRQVLRDYMQLPRS